MIEAVKVAVIGTGNNASALVQGVALYRATGSLLPVHPATGTERADSSAASGVRAMTNLVGRLGLEPRTNGLKVHCSTIELTPLVVQGH
jgi:hypothetical protein